MTSVTSAFCDVFITFDPMRKADAHSVGGRNVCKTSSNIDESISDFNLALTTEGDPLVSSA